MTNSTKRRALIFWGGWDGHKPEVITQIFSAELEKHGFLVDRIDSLDPLADAPALLQYDLIMPCWTMGKMEKEQSAGLVEAVRSGVGLGGIHGGMGDAFRGNIDYEWMVGGLFLGHPHVGEYTIWRTREKHAATNDLPAEFSYKSEQYYMAVDPGVTVLADTDYTHEGRTCRMPVVWTKQWGKGRVFYSSLGHDPEEFNTYPHVKEMTVRGLLWAARF